MPSVHDVLQWANRTAVAQEITRRGYRVSPETLNRWYRQRSEVPAVVEHIVFDLFGIRGHDESPPTWAEGLEERVAGAVLSGLAAPDRLRAALYAIESLDNPEAQPGGSHASDASAQGPAAGAPPAQRRGRSLGRGSADRGVT